MSQEPLNHFFRPVIDASVTDAAGLFKRPSLQMIDFGVSIDLTLFPPATTFNVCFEKAENRSPEMLDGRPWTFQVVMT